MPDYNALVDWMLSTSDDFCLCPATLTVVSGIMDILAYEQVLIIGQSVCTFVLAAREVWGPEQRKLGRGLQGVCNW